MVLETVDGIRIMCDPYDESFGYSIPNDNVDIVTVSHNHFDHNAVSIVKGEPLVIRDKGEYEYEGIKIKGIHTWHDPVGGNKRGENIVFKFCMDNINFIHMGDIGHVLTDGQINDLKPCDILAVPVGGIYTVNTNEAREIVKQLNPQIVIPIHYHTPSGTGELNTADEFLKEFMEVKREKIWEGIRTDIPRETVACVLFAHGEQKS
jgi:L-ascorbate metabolism protein UlaG (beta-lactamase superfamily)